MRQKSDSNANIAKMKKSYFTTFCCQPSMSNHIEYSILNFAWGYGLNSLSGVYHRDTIPNMWGPKIE